MRLLIAAAALGLITTGCSSSSNHRAAANEPPHPFIRVVTTDSNLVQLQIAARKFMPVRGRGPAIWLVGASHIGEPEYYQALQQLLDRQTLVLFEGVGGGAMKERSAHVRSGEKRDAAQPSQLSSLQTTLAASLGLVFQLDAVDYDRPHFRNSDLSITELRAVMSSMEGDGAGDTEFNQMLALMEGGSAFSSIIEFGLRFIGSNPKLRATARLVMIEVLGGFSGSMAEFQGLPAEMQRLLKVLIENRNAKVAADLRAELASGNIRTRGTIAVFYGTAHMDDFERRLQSDLGYRPVEDVWLTPFSVNLATARISVAEWTTIRNFATAQLQRMRASPRSGGAR